MSVHDTLRRIIIRDIVISVVTVGWCISIVD